MKKLQTITTVLLLVGGMVLPSTAANATTVKKNNCEQLLRDVISAYYNAGYSYEEASAAGSDAYAGCI